MSLRTLVIIIVGLAAIIEDTGWRRISNWTSGGAVLAGLILHSVEKGWTGLLHSLEGTAIGFGVFLIFYLLGGMGGGDVKLMAGFGALLGVRQILAASLLAAATGGLMALGYVAVRSVARRSKVWMGFGPPDVAAEGGQAAESIPYAPAITVGAWLALVSNL